MVRRITYFTYTRKGVTSDFDAVSEKSAKHLSRPNVTACTGAGGTSGERGILCTTPAPTVRERGSLVRERGSLAYTGIHGINIAPKTFVSCSYDKSDSYNQFLPFSIVVFPGTGRGRDPMAGRHALDLCLALAVALRQTYDGAKAYHVIIFANTW